MAVKIRSSQLETRTQRAKLTPRGNPYVVKVAPGIRLGYRQTKTPPGWYVKVANGKGTSWQRDLDAWADDIEDADGKPILNDWQAIDVAKRLARAARTTPMATGRRRSAKLWETTRSLDELAGVVTAYLCDSRRSPRRLSRMGGRHRYGLPPRGENPHRLPRRKHITRCFVP
jgi:hypothetical protein